MPADAIQNLPSNFGTIDWAIVAAYLAGTVAVGIYANRFIRNMADYMVAGRSLKPYLAVATMIGSELGLVTVMYMAQKGFTGGFAAFHIGLIAGVSTLIIGLTGFIVVPLRAMGVMTIPEFYERRFGRGVRIAGGIILAFAGILNMGLFLKAGAIFVTGLTGLTDPIYVSLVMTVMLAIVLLYTILGGMVSVVITDYVQFVVLSFGIIFACGMAVHTLGWSHIVDTVRVIHGEAGFNPMHEGTGFGPSYMVWMIFTAGIVSSAVWQTSVMRACAAESTAVVKKLYVWSSIGFLIRFMLPQFLGICALVYFFHHDAGRAVFFSGSAPVTDSAVTLRAMPVFLSQILPAGIIGLIGAGLLAAFMSTHDSYLLCWASVLTHDVVAPISGETLSTRARLLLSRAFIFIIGAFLLVWGLWYDLGQDLWDYMAISGAIYFTGAFALLCLGLYWKRASTTGAYLALFAGIASIVGLVPVKKALGLEVLTAAHVGLGAASLSLILMFVGSLL
ncbi:MAG: sodium:solute symporter family protein, partial [Candidatus Latescibacteria bacterium]|nr:sodium:solute symporter family protein [Candidatus Latescibacterota bacterium]